ncbi:MAG: S8 family serine peptidase [Bryobacteraceae bacterium]
MTIISTFTSISFAQGKRVSGQLLVQPRNGAVASKVNQALATHGASIKQTLTKLNVHVIQVPEPALERVRDALSKTGLFTFVEQDAIASGAAVPNDPNYVYQWHLTTISAPAAWDINTGSAAVVVAVIDSGVDSTHPDLASKLVPGWSFLNGTSNTADVLGHGTAVAGAIAAATNNGVGVAGVSWNSLIMPLVVLDSNNSASYSNIANAIIYAADRGVRIMNVSITGASSSSTMQSAINYAWSKGSVVFAAAGNSTSTALFYPASCENAVAVSSTGQTDALSYFSNSGSWIDLSAPGESIFTAFNGGGYGYKSGTSFSSPIAAGVGSLALSRKPSLSASALVSLLQQNSDDLGAPGFDNSFGWGRVNAYKAVFAADGVVTDTVLPSVVISTPGNGTTVSGTIQVAGTATDNVGVTAVELWVDGQLAGSAASAAYSYSLSTAGMTNGSHSLSVKAYDAAGNAGTALVAVSVSNTVLPVSVADTQAPSVTITNPYGGSKMGSVVKISASATDNVGVSQVCIYIDGILKYTGTAAPYAYNWNTKKDSPGTHVITSQAWDTSGNVASATPVSVYK